MWEQKTSEVVKKILRDMTGHDEKELKFEFKQRKANSDKNAQLEIISDYLEK